jgi:ribosomal protein S27AE
MPTEIEPTYSIITETVPRTGIKCALCGSVSYNAGDIQEKYCGRCHLFHQIVEDGRRMLATGATHDCGEWRTARDRCALCDRDLGPRRT